MNVNGVTGVTRTYVGYNNTKKVSTPKKSENSNDVAAVYEKSSGMSTISNPKKVNDMKLELNSKLNDMQNLVSTMFKKQGIAFNNADEMWKKLASGEFTADAETISQAKADIAEDGYWGVKNTSERMFDFAKALAGDDPEKMKKMQEAVKKGFDEATKAWGKELPSISKDTLDAVNKLFDDYFAN